MKNFHSYYLNLLKEKSKASMVAWETERGVTRLKFIFDGKPHYLPITGGFEGVNVETYCQILNELM